jgi:hypothetical protein
MKDLTLDIELCAYMLAIVLERHVVTSDNEICYYTAAELASEANSYNVDMSSEYCVLKAAVHQGMRLMKKGLESNGFILDIVYPTVKRIQAMSEFGAFRAFNNGWKVKFTNTTEKDNTSLRERVVKRRDSLLGFSLYKTSEYSDIRVIIHEMDMAMPDASYDTYAGSRYAADRGCAAHRFRIPTRCSSEFCTSTHLHQHSSQTQSVDGLCKLSSFVAYKLS